MSGVSDASACSIPSTVIASPSQNGDPIMTDTTEGERPKPTSYFYTEALQAAWMSKHFGMSFTLPASCDHQWNNPGHKIAWANLADMDCGHFHIYNAAGNGVTLLRFCESIAPLYVHPDSLHLLNLHEGDLALDDDPMDGGFRWFDVHPVAAVRKFTRIIQRGGIPFHWPQSE
jgi:hypothetical protein